MGPGRLDPLYAHTDEMGGRSMWMMTFLTDTVTLDQVRLQHRNEEDRERIARTMRV